MMSEYVIHAEDAKTLYGNTDFPFPLDAYLREKVVRCRDCRHATISSLGYVKYCEKFVLPDEDGYGANPQVNLPFDFFCAYGVPRGDA